MTTNGYGNEDYPSQLDDNIASPAVDSGVHKKRLRSWLLDKLDTNDCPGCTWINKEQRIFKLTWKHYGRPGFDEERDAKIFRDWAIHTRRYQLGEPTDVSTWKTRFRNALHKMPDIEELSSYHQLDGNDPYRVYRFRTPEEMEQIRDMQRTAQQPPASERYPPRYSAAMNFTTEEQKIEDIKKNLISEVSQCGNGALTQQLNQQQQHQQLQHQQHQQQHQHQQMHPQQLQQHHQHLPQQPPQMQQLPMNNNEYMLPPFDDDALDDIEKILMKEMNEGVNGDTPSQMQQITNSFFPNISQYNFNNIPMSAIGVKMYFSDKEVGCNIVNNLNYKGVRISYKPPPPVHPDMVSEEEAKNILKEIYGPLEAEQIYYPHSDDRNTQKILKVMQRGVVIEVNQQGDIIATRLSQARIFYSDSVTTPPKALQRGVPTMVYSFQNDFLPTLDCYQRGMAFSPSCERYFTFGQSWSEHEPLKEMLIHFSITHFLSKKIFKEVKAQKPATFIQCSDADTVDIIKEKLDKMYMSNVPS